MIVGYGNVTAERPPIPQQWGRAFTPIAAAWIDLFGEYLGDVLITITDDDDQQSSAYSLDVSGGVGLHEPGGNNNAVYPIEFVALKPGWSASPASRIATEPGVGGEVVTFTMTPGGVPPTGQTTSHETGDDGDLEFGMKG